MKRFFIFGFLFVMLLPHMAAAQDFLDEKFMEDDVYFDPRGLPVDEYDHIPVGMLAPPDADTKTDQPVVNADAPPVLPPASVNGKVNTLSFEEILALYAQQKYADILPSLEFLSSNGHIPATELMGIMYRSGRGVKKDDARAFDLLSRAAEEKHPRALHHLAIMYFRGDGVPEKSALQAQVFLNLAIIYYREDAEKQRALRDRETVSNALSRRDRENAYDLTREWLDRKGDRRLMP